MTKFSLHHLRALEIFHKIALNGSFTKSAMELQITQPAVSASLNSLEEFLGMKLFVRYAKGLVLTEAGTSLLELTTKLLSDMSEFEIWLEAIRKNEQNIINISLCSGLGLEFLLPFFKIVKEESKGFDLTVNYTDHLEEFLHVRIGSGNYSGEVTTVKVCSFSYGLYASKEFLKKNKDISSLEDIFDFCLLKVGKAELFTIDEWFDIENDFKSKMCFDNFDVFQDVLKRDIGVAILPNQVKHDGLTRLFPEIESPELDINLIYRFGLSNLAYLIGFVKELEHFVGSAVIPKKK